MVKKCQNSLSGTLLVNAGSSAGWKNAHHPVDRTSNWCTDGCCFTLALAGITRVYSPLQKELACPRLWALRIAYPQYHNYCLVSLDSQCFFIFQFADGADSWTFKLIKISAQIMNNFSKFWRNKNKLIYAEMVKVLVSYIVKKEWSLPWLRSVRTLATEWEGNNQEEEEKKTFGQRIWLT
jgi:hypothetical protein